MLRRFSSRVVSQATSLVKVIASGVVLPRATVRERRAGVWEVRVFSGTDEAGRPTQVSRTVHGTKKDARRVAAELTLKASNAAGRTVGDLLSAWIDQRRHLGPVHARDRTSRAERIRNNPIALMPLARLAPADLDRWHGRLRKAGVGEAAVRNRHVVLELP